MLVVMQEGATEPQIEEVSKKLEAIGYAVHRVTGVSHTILGGVGEDKADPAEFSILPGVRECVRVSSTYKLAARSVRPGGTVVKIGDVEVGGDKVVVMGGPCSVETRDQFRACAEQVAKAGAKVVRGGAFKPRSSPYSFQGLGEKGLVIMREAADEFGLKVISEVMEISQIPMMLPYIDVFQVGARNMQNFNLLKALGDVRKPVLLKRGIAATIEELLLSSEYILAGGNYDVMLCERGIRTYETYTRNTMDVSAIPVVKKLSHLPMVADPSHGTGRRDQVLPMARASVAAGADALIVEMHNDPNKAYSDGAQSLFPEQFAEMVGQCRIIASAIGRSI
ncbi:MAG: 3-deoxy-7-phosphoheptulonate synthase [Bryobacteraceae bacterium]|jgi:3-deoxy-7-phosphoheptulonate synthase|nr:3-deoxy-7-phosphoheptulonate synthase [Bryobacteraceae bacterium]